MQHITKIYAFAQMKCKKVELKKQSQKLQKYKNMNLHKIRHIN